MESNFKTGETVRHKNGFQYKIVYERADGRFFMVGVHCGVRPYGIVTEAQEIRSDDE